MIATAVTAYSRPIPEVPEQPVTQPIVWEEPERQVEPETESVQEPEPEVVVESEPVEWYVSSGEEDMLGNITTIYRFCTTQWEEAAAEN